MKKQVEAGGRKSSKQNQPADAQKQGDESSEGRSGKHADTEDPVSRRKGTGRHGEWIRRGTTDSPGAVDPQDESPPEK